MRLEHVTVMSQGSSQRGQSQRAGGQPLHSIAPTASRLSVGTGAFGSSFPMGSSIGSELCVACQPFRLETWHPSPATRSV
jgi:hypothetical protein